MTRPPQTLQRAKQTATATLHETEKLINQAQACEMLQCSRATFYRFIKEANITSIKISPRVIRYMPSQIRGILESGGVSRKVG